MNDRMKVLYIAVGLFALGAIMAASGHRENATLMVLGLVCLFSGAACGIMWLAMLVFGPGKKNEWTEN